MRSKLIIILLLMASFASAQDSSWVVVSTDSAIIFQAESDICNVVCAVPDSCRWDFIYKRGTEYCFPIFWEDSRMRTILPIIDGIEIRFVYLPDWAVIY